MATQLLKIAETEKIIFLVIKFVLIRNKCLKLEIIICQINSWKNTPGATDLNFNYNVTFLGYEEVNHLCRQNSLNETLGRKSGGATDQHKFSGS